MKKSKEANMDFKEMCKEIYVQCFLLKEYGLEEKRSKGTIKYMCILSFQGKTIASKFYTFIGFSNEDVFISLLDESNIFSSSNKSFKTFCKNEGFDTDSLKARKRWKRIKKNDKKIRYLLGDEYEKFSQEVVKFYKNKVSEYEKQH